MGSDIMDYLKFNCYDLATQNIELHRVYINMKNLNDELDSILNSLDPQIKSYEGIQKQIVVTKLDTADIVVRIFTAYNVLDQIIDVYYAAEGRVQQASEELPVGLVKQANTAIFNSSDGTLKISTSSISSGDLVLEDWLAELIYKPKNEW